MAVKLLLADSIVTAEPSTPVRDLAEIMDRHKVGSGSIRTVPADPSTPSS